MIEKYPDKPWDWIWISYNPNITMEFVEKYPDKPWNWYRLSQNPNITMEIIENIQINHGIGIGFHVIQISPWRLLKNIQINHGIGMDFHIIQISLWKSLKNIQINHGIGMNCHRNPNITMDIIEKYPNKPWNWSDFNNLFEINST